MSDAGDKLRARAEQEDKEVQKHQNQAEQYRNQAAQEDMNEANRLREQAKQEEAKANQSSSSSSLF